MKTSVILIVILMLCSSMATAIPWALTPTDDTHSLFHSFGDFHTPWLDAAVGLNFHAGVDLSDPNPASSFFYAAVSSVAGGTETYCEDETVAGHNIIDRVWSNC